MIQASRSQRRYVGCAGWSIPRPFAGSFPPTGTQLERYARIFPAVEINSSFYRHHRPETYRRWASVVPYDFRFSVKAPRSITHERRLVDTDDILARFLAEIAELEEKLGPLLVQLPPSLAHDEGTVDTFLEALRETFHGAVALEPRHASWFTPAVDAQLAEFKVARVAADPACVPAAAAPGGCANVAYYRLHGSPQIYYSPYEEKALDALADRLVRPPGSAVGETWCIFDNTTVGYATDNALYMLKALRPSRVNAT